MVMPNVLAIYTMVEFGSHDIGLVHGHSRVDAVPYHVSRESYPGLCILLG